VISWLLLLFCITLCMPLADGTVNGECIICVMSKTLKASQNKSGSVIKPFLIYNRLKCKLYFTVSLNSPHIYQHIDCFWHIVYQSLSVLWLWLWCYKVKKTVKQNTKALRLSHTCHAASLPFSDSAVSSVEVHEVAGRNWTWAGRPQVVSGRPMPIHTCRAHITLCCGLETSLSERHGRGMAWARHGMCESNTASLCKSSGKDTV
jgi:hypothetical protein